MESLRLADLNRADRERFVELVGHVVEDSPWVAEAIAGERPFVAKDDVQAAFHRALRTADPQRQMDVLRAHPDLGVRLDALAGSSADEQAGAGLAGLGDAERRRFTELNAAYRAKFGFPFIFAVKGARPADIIAAFEARLPNAPADEKAEALRQVERIIAFRLDDLLR